ncbi:acetyltransferase, partial [Prochlorococcus sp. HOT_208_60]
GKGSVIGANSVVVGAIQPFSIAVGIPAKIKKKFEKKTRNWEKKL